MADDLNTPTPDDASNVTETSYAEFRRLLENFAIPADAAPSSTGVIAMSEASPEQLDQAFRNRIESLGAPEFLTRIMTPNSYDSLLFFLATTSSSERLRTLRMFSEFKDEPKPEKFFQTPEGQKLGNTALQTPKVGGRITGDNGLTVIMGSRPGKIRRILLINSGFCVTVRPPTPDDLNLLVMRCQLDSESYGRRIGAVYYAYFDLILKQNFIELFLSLVISAGLKDAAKPGVMIQHFKLQDLNHVLTEIARMQHPTGWEGFTHICTSAPTPERPTGCDHKETLKGDISTLIRTRWSKLSPKALAHLAKARQINAIITPEELVEYQKELGFDQTMFEYGDWRWFLRTPTLSDHLVAGEEFNKSIMNEVDANNREGIQSVLKFRQLRMFLPCISKIVSTDEFDEDTEPTWTDEKAIIAGLLDVVSGDELSGTPLLERLVKFMDESQLTMIGYPTFECPKCHNVPEAEFIPVDAASTFFTLAWYLSNKDSGQTTAA